MARRTGLFLPPVSPVISFMKPASRFSTLCHSTSRSPGWTQPLWVIGLLLAMLGGLPQACASELNPQEQRRAADASQVALREYQATLQAYNAITQRVPTETNCDQLWKDAEEAMRLEMDWSNSIASRAALAIYAAPRNDMAAVYRFQRVLNEVRAQFEILRKPLADPPPNFYGLLEAIVNRYEHLHCGQKEFDRVNGEMNRATDDFVEQGRRAEEAIRRCDWNAFQSALNNMNRYPDVCQELSQGVKAFWAPKGSFMAPFYHVSDLESEAWYRQYRRKLEELIQVWERVRLDEQNEFKRVWSEWWRKCGDRRGSQPESPPRIPGATQTTSSEQPPTAGQRPPTGPRPLTGEPPPKDLSIYPDGTLPPEPPPPDATSKRPPKDLSIYPDGTVPPEFPPKDVTPRQPATHVASCCELCPSNKQERYYVPIAPDTDCQPGDVRRDDLSMKAGTCANPLLETGVDVGPWTFGPSCCSKQTSQVLYDSVSTDGVTSQVGSVLHGGGCPDDPCKLAPSAPDGARPKEVDVSILSTAPDPNGRNWVPENPVLRVGKERLRPCAQSKFYVTKEATGSGREAATAILSAISADYADEAAHAADSPGTSCPSHGGGGPSRAQEAREKATAAAGLALLASQAKGQITGLRATFNVTGKEGQLNDAKLDADIVNEVTQKKVRMTMPVRFESSSPSQQ